GGTKVFTRIRKEDGIAMVAVVGVVALISAVAMGGFVLSRQVLHESVRVERESKAFQVAQSGMDRELATFAPDKLTDGFLEKTGRTEDGTYTITVEPAGGTADPLFGEYLLTSTGEASGASESVSMNFFYIDLWNMNIGGGENASIGGGRGFNGNATITGPLYIRGNMEWSSNANYEGGPLFIKDGHLEVTGSGTLGKLKPIKCYITNGAFGNKIGNLYPDGPISSSVPDIELPWVDAAYMSTKYDLAKEESADQLMGSASRAIANTTEVTTLGNPSTYGGSGPVATPASTSAFYKYIGASTGPKALGAGTTNLTIGATSFGRWEGNGYPAASGLHDDFAFNAATGTLYVEGTVFIDGVLTLGENVRNYVGNGTLVVNNNVFIFGDLLPKTALSAEEALGIVTPGNVTIGESNNTAHFKGGIFANGVVGLYGAAGADPTWVEGAILCGVIYGDKPNLNIHMNPLLSAAGVESLPGSGGGIVYQGTWSRN
ncbi:MAG: hypothetical protein U1E22_01610, partial [Coriobacteriia bacterium]|nr:hypothetical protein [Coriobacteriia bacterium]